MNFPSTYEQYNEVALEKLRFGFMCNIDRHLEDVCTIDIHDDLLYSLGREMAVRVNGFVFKENLDEVEIKYPADWWQAVKERFAPEWFIRWYPVRYEERAWDLIAVYPRVAGKISMPGEQHCLRMTERL